jgi:hypothetical protein
MRKLINAELYAKLVEYDVIKHRLHDTTETNNIDDLPKRITGWKQLTALQHSKMMDVVREVATAVNEAKNESEVLELDPFGGKIDDRLNFMESLLHERGVSGSDRAEKRKASLMCNWLLELDNSVL